MLLSLQTSVDPTLRPVRTPPSSTEDAADGGAGAVVSEINQMKTEINESYDHLDKWAKPTKVKTSAAWALASATVYNVPKGRSRSLEAGGWELINSWSGRCCARYWNVEL